MASRPSTEGRARNLRSGKTVPLESSDSQPIESNGPSPPPSPGLKTQFLSLQEEVAETKSALVEQKESLHKIQELLLALTPQSDSRERSGQRQASPYPNSDEPLTTIETPRQASETPSYERKRSQKFPDPQRLSDGNEPSFEEWQIAIGGKLEINEDYYSTEKSKMYYIYDRTEGDARKYLYERFRPDSSMKFRDAEEMLDCLREIFVNPHEQREAAHQYNRLKMQPSQAFHTFKTTFLHLAAKARIPKGNLRMDLYDRITLPLQRQVVIILDTLTDTKSLCDALGRLDIENKHLDRRETRTNQALTRQTTTASRTSIPLAHSPASFPVVSQRSATPAPVRLSSAVPETSRQATPFGTSKTVTCYNCGQSGHLSKDCTKPRRSYDVKDIGEDSEGELERTEKEQDSGKEYA